MQAPNPSRPPFAPPAVDSPQEARIRQLLANGKAKAAVDLAKEHHKAVGSASSETLLVDAYAARIRALLDQNMTTEAASLADLVRSRFPRSAGKLDGLTAAAAARQGSLADVLAPLNDPGLDADRRAAIEEVIRRDVHHLAAVAACPSLGSDHPLRIAAAALDRAFTAVTSGPVTDDVLELPEVSRRSPLAPWKVLIRAIACYYRGDDAACRECLDSTPPDSAAARLVPAIRVMLGGSPPAPLTPAAAALVSATAGNRHALESSIKTLEKALESGKQRSILEAVRAAANECRKSAPDRLEKLKQHISVLCALQGIDFEKVVSALGGPAVHDAYFHRLHARGIEDEHDPTLRLSACAEWEFFRREALKEGWFAAKSPEIATLYLHIAKLAGDVPLGSLMQSRAAAAREQHLLPMGDDYFLFPEKTYERACTIDPHPEGFRAWLDWAKKGPTPQAERVAEGWAAARPNDLEPSLYLMRAYAARGAFPTALKHLAHAERIDGLNSEVRRARVELLGRSAVKHLQQRKPHLAEKKIAEMTELPQVQQGNRHAFLSAVRFVASWQNRDEAGMAACRAEAARLLGPLAADMIIATIARDSKQYGAMACLDVSKLDKEAREGMPAAVARAVELIADVNATRMWLTSDILHETARQIQRNGKALEITPLFLLAKAGIDFHHAELAYAATAAGLERGTMDPRFLFLRGKALQDRQPDRYLVCAAAAGQLARAYRDMSLVQEVVDVLRRAGMEDAADMSAEDAAAVLRKEKAAKTLQSKAPDYSKLNSSLTCPCPDCRARRAGLDPDADFDDDEFEDEDSDHDFDDPFGNASPPGPMSEAEINEIVDDLIPPPAMPRWMFDFLRDQMKEALRNGEDMEQVMRRLMKKGFPGEFKKSRRR